MFTTFLATTNSNGSLTLFASIIVAVLVAAGAGFKVFTLFRTKKLNNESLPDIINSVYEDEACIDLLKSVFTVECFQKSNTYEEFIVNIKADAQTKLYDYLSKNATCIPSYLLKFITVENIECIVGSLLVMLGYNTEKLTNMFEEYIADLVTEDIAAPIVEDTTITEPVTEDTVETESNDSEPITEETPDPSPVIEAAEEVETEEVSSVSEATYEETVVTEEVVNSDVDTSVETTEETTATEEVETEE